MGVDISGKNSISETGDYFASNWWGWRPIHQLCELAAYESKLPIDFSYWGSNDGKGLDTQEECNALADALEEYLGNEIEVKDDDERIFLCLGSWCEAGTGKMVESNVAVSLNEQYDYGDILYTSVVSESGQLVEPSYSISIFRIKEFIKFLRECGGFEIW
jgi:hypothetical protein